MKEKVYLEWNKLPRGHVKGEVQPGCLVIEGFDLYEFKNLKDRKYPNFVRALKERNHNYNIECDEIDELEKKGKVFAIAPSIPVTISRLESDVDKLGNLYWLRYHDTL